jgi:DNA mismatch repair protein MutL
MCAKIHRLDNLTTNQIAAGEVIERPVSIVKELVENAIDAGSRRIEVEIKEGGLAYIGIRDDGSGIVAEDLPLAIERHATSKLQVIEDLDNLTTLGFRGEALASIASVAALTIISRTPDQHQGQRLFVKGDVIEPRIDTIGCPIGTAVIIEDLFFNTPARLKFMKAAGYESGLIHDLLIQMSLGYPEISFKMTAQDKVILDTTGIQRIEDLIEHFYGKDGRVALVPIQGKVSQATIAGMITAPPYSRGTRKAVHIFVNGRRITSKEMLWAIERGFEYLLPKGRFPVAILEFQIPGDLLDVNVHPGKLEVRINDSPLYSALTRLIRSAVSGGQTMPDYSSYGEILGVSDPIPEVKPSSTYSQVFFDNTKPLWQEAYTTEQLAEQSFVAPPINSEPRHEEFDFGPEMTYKIIGQLHRTFILAETPIGLMIIDQHVAHERVLYEQLLEKHQGASLPAQMLLTPLTLNLTISEEETLIKNIMVLNELGIIVERFGQRSYILRSAPMGQADITPDFFKDFLATLNDEPNQVGQVNPRDALLVMMSCKAAIKANQLLSLQEMEALLRQLQQTKHPMTCPHGRPIIYLLPFNRLLRAFGRSS